MKRMRRIRRSKDQIRGLLTEFSKSGLTVKQFCQPLHISTVTFNKWQSRFKTKFVQEAFASGFTPIKIGPSSAGLFAEINGIRLYQPVSAAYLKELQS